MISFIFDQLDELLDELFRTATETPRAAGSASAFEAQKEKLEVAMGSHCLDGQDEIQDYLKSEHIQMFQFYH